MATPFRLKLEPGFFTEDSDRNAENRWKDGNLVRFKDGRPEKFGGWEEAVITGETLQGIDRREHEWTSLDGQPWIAQGTSKKLYIINRGIRYDITPVRRSVSLTDPFTTVLGDATVTVTDPLHGAETGDFVRFTGATAVGGLTIDGEYVVTVLNGNTYTIEAAGPASSAATGGGTVFADYDINIGGDSAAQAHGYGTCLYGRGTWGTRRGDCSAIITPLRVWSLDNFGEDLLASPRGGALYWWDRSLGPGTRAVVIETAPQSIERMLVSPSGDQIIALGASDFNGAPDKMLIRTSDTGSIVDWVQPDDLDAENNVFDERLSNGSRIITGTKTRGGVLVNTDKMSYIMRADPTNIWAIEELAAQNAPAGPNATLDVNGTAYWMAQKKFATFDGVQVELPCEVWGYIFDNEAAAEGKTPGFNLAQADKVYAYYNDKGDEATWFYPSFESDENDRYVCFNTTQRIWYYGSLARTAMSTGGLAYSLPYGSAPTGELFLHEGVRDADGEIMGEYIESYDMMIGEGEFASHISMFEPDFKRWVGTMRLTLKTKDTPNQATYGLTANYDMLDTITEQGTFIAGRQMAVRFSSITLGSTWRMAAGTFYGQPDAGR